jgi:hypothetical protein
MSKTTLTIITLLTCGGIRDIASATVVPIAVPDGEGTTASLLVLGVGLMLLAFSVVRRRLQRTS